MPSLDQKIVGGLWGVLVADALGLPHQFKTASAIHDTITMEMAHEPSYPKAFPRIEYGTWSDDGALTLALTDSLANQKRLDLDHFAGNVRRWFEKGAFTVDGKAYDVGNTTSEACCRLVRGHPPEAAGIAEMSANGNGSLMRTLPLALWHQGTDTELYADACVQSSVTHRHDISKAACGVYCVAARAMMNGVPTASAWVQGLKLAHVELDIPKDPKGSGFVLDSLAYAIQASRSGKSYRDVVLGAIRLGADTDTTACIAGGIIAARDGDSVIPQEWFLSLRGFLQAQEVIGKFLSARLG